jgi:hypothetical protein
MESVPQHSDKLLENHTAWILYHNVKQQENEDIFKFKVDLRLLRVLNVMKVLNPIQIS